MTNHHTHTPSDVCELQKIGFLFQVESPLPCLLATSWWSTSSPGGEPSMAIRRLALQQTSQPNHNKVKWVAGQLLFKIITVSKAIDAYSSSLTNVTTRFLSCTCTRPRTVKTLSCTCYWYRLLQNLCFLYTKRFLCHSGLVRMTFPPGAMLENTRQPRALCEMATIRQMIKKTPQNPPNKHEAAVFQSFLMCL